MDTDGVLDLTNLDWPISLFKFYDTFRSWPTDFSLVVWIRDPQVANSLKTIVQNSGSRITRMDQLNGCFHIWIRKIGHLNSISEAGGSGNE